jgi:2-dehydro-3-deoxyphosphooctonate aldolase (KDO 8-P synthase)
MPDILYDVLNNCKTFFLISGPCVIEDKDTMFKVAETLVTITSKKNIPFVFKTSFLKANRTSVESYSGPGLEEGLSILQSLKSHFHFPILTDVHETSDIGSVSEVCDILQIPAFLSRQTVLIQSAARTGKIINIKKGQFMAPEDMQAAANKVFSCDNNKILLTERGSSFGYHNLVVDFRSFAIMKSFGYPVVYDVTHSLQKPSENKQSGGSPEYVLMMAQAAIATGYVDGLFIETHPNPHKALSDSKSMLALEKLPMLIDNCLIIKDSLGKSYG